MDPEANYQTIGIGDIAHAGSVISVGVAFLLSLVLALVIVRRARSTQVWLPLLLTVTIPFVVCLLCAFVVGAEDFYAISMSRDAHASDSYMALATLLFSLWIGIVCSLICAIVAVIPLIRRALRARDDGSADAAGLAQVSASVDSNKVVGKFPTAKSDVSGCTIVAERDAHPSPRLWH